MSKTLRAVLAVPVLFLVALLVAAGCGAGGSADGGSSAADASSVTDAKSGPTRSSGESTDGSGTAPGLASSATRQGDGATKANRTSVTAMERAVISNGHVSLRARSVADARSEVMRLVSSWNGTVADEQTDSDDRGRLTSSTMTLRVPSNRFGEAMTALAGVAEVEHQSRTSEDVTTQVIDNEARVRAAERSIRQIEALLGRARQLSDIITIESDLASRQADLDSLKSQQAWLQDQTSLSTINVQVDRATPGGQEQHETRGFLAGLGAGWDAFTAATVGLLTVLGAVLPFVVLLVVLGVPVWLVVRRRVSAGSAPARTA